MHCSLNNFNTQPTQTISTLRVTVMRSVQRRGQNKTKKFILKYQASSFSDSVTSNFSFLFVPRFTQPLRKKCHIQFSEPSNKIYNICWVSKFNHCAFKYCFSNIRYVKTLCVVLPTFRNFDASMS
jgi:hypothetical protein